MFDMAGIVVPLPVTPGQDDYTQGLSPSRSRPLCARTGSGLALIRPLAQGSRFCREPRLMSWIPT